MTLGTLWGPLFIWAVGTVSKWSEKRINSGDRDQAVHSEDSISQSWTQVGNRARLFLCSLFGHGVPGWGRDELAQESWDTLDPARVDWGWHFQHIPNGNVVPEPEQVQNKKKKIFLNCFMVGKAYWNIISNTCSKIGKGELFSTGMLRKGKEVFLG